MEKAQARKFAKERLNDLTLYEKKLADKKICDSLFENENLSQMAKNVCIYNSISEEVSTQELLKKLLESNCKIFMPIVIQEEMEFAEVNFDTRFSCGKWGIYEPIGERIKAENLLINLCITPLTAFDRQLNRVGKGKGFYDKFFAKCPCEKIGIAYSCQEVGQVETNIFDCKLDKIYTEKEIIK